MLTGSGASISNLKEQEQNFICTNTTRLVDKDLDFRPQCVKVQSIEDLRNHPIDGLCTVEVKVCEVGNAVSYMFEQSDVKRIQKLRKRLVVGDKTGALELYIWEANFNQLKLNESYQMKFVKSRISTSSEISLSTVAETL